jgi:hypothetical protein
MLLNAGNDNLRKLLGGVSGGLPYTKMAFGTSDTPVQATDTTITGAVVKAITAVNVLSGGIVEFTATLGPSDPAMTIKEVGLLDANNVLLHRKVITPFNKLVGETRQSSFKITVQ